MASFDEVSLAALLGALLVVSFIVSKILSVFKMFHHECHAQNERREQYAVAGDSTFNWRLRFSIKKASEITTGFNPNANIFLHSLLNGRAATGYNLSCTHLLPVPLSMLQEPSRQPRLSSSLKY